MPLELIPNQPFVFEKPIGDYPCLNNDPKAYAQLVQDGDVSCVQWKLVACDEPLCEPEMVQDPIGADELGAWTVGGGWSSASSGTLDYIGPDLLPATAGQSLNLTVGAAYLFTGNVDTYTGGKDYLVILGSSVIPLGNIPQSGQFSIGFTAYETPITLAIISDPSTAIGDTLQLSGLELKQYTTCWVDDLNSGLPSWSYEFDGANGKFCSSDPSGGNLSNGTAFTTTGNYHGVELTISDSTEGGLEVQLGTVTLGITLGNGTFRYYGIPTAGTTLRLVKVDNFDGCVSQVTVFDYGDLSTVAVTVRSDDNFYKSDALNPTPFEDRLVQCIDWETLDWNINGTPTDCIPLRIDIKDACDNNVIYISVNRALYKSGGAEWECTKWVESWNDGFAFGFYFGDIANPDFKLTQRLRVLAFNPVYRNAGEEYLYSSGNTGRSFAQSQKARTAWFDYMDEYAHDCTRTQLLSQKLFIDGYAFYYPTEDYEPEWNERGQYNLAQSRVTVFHEEAIFGSTCGTMANAVCPPQIVPSPVKSYSQIQMKGTYTTSGLDFTNCSFGALAFDENGVLVDLTPSPCSVGAYDLTNPVDRALALADIICLIDYVFGISAIGTFNLTGPSMSGAYTISIDISASVSIPAPCPVISIAFYDTSVSVPLPFATIPS